VRRDGVSSSPGPRDLPSPGTLRIGPEAVLVPVKAFTEAKRRLAPALPPHERATLARSMAEKVVAAAGDLPVAVVCDDNDVAVWARQRGALVIWEPEQGLNRAVEAGVSRLGAAGAVQVTVAHGDLPLAADLTWLGRFAGVTLVPDRHHNGTNVACVPTAAAFRFSYGPGSFVRHEHEARRLGLPLRIVDEPLLAWDVDQPGDLDFGRCR
jgi:2-phospho-L-lactate guanylyltransferase